jgi:hypothetical protein
MERNVRKFEKGKLIPYDKASNPFCRAKNQGKTYKVLKTL